MANKITKVPPLRGASQEQIEALRRHINMMADEILRILEDKDREIAHLKEVVERDG